MLGPLLLGEVLEPALVFVGDEPVGEHAAGLVHPHAAEVGRGRHAAVVHHEHTLQAMERRKKGEHKAVCCVYPHGCTS